MAVVYRGTLQPKLQKYTTTYSPQSGYTRTYDYRGFGEALMVSLMNQFTSQNCEVTLAGEHDVFTLQVRDSTGEVTLDTWQIQQSDERPSSLQNPRNIANTTDNERKVIKRAVSGNVTPQQAKEDIQSETGSNPGDLGTYASRLYDRMNEGGTEFTRSIYVLRHTTNAPSNYSVNNADWNVDCIYTVNQLLAEVQDSSLWRLPLPPRLVYKIQNLLFPAVRSNYQNGWLKRGSSESTAANFRIEICTEYVMGQWSTDEYPLAV